MEPKLEQIVESILFAADQPIKADFIWTVLSSKAENKAAESSNPSEETDSTVLEGFDQEQLEEILNHLLQKYQAEKYPFEIREVAEGYQFFTKRHFYPYVKAASLNKNKKRLSRAALETLAIIAYRQPITKAEMEFIRGVNCDYAVQKLLDKHLVSIIGRAEAPGRPLLYATSPFFMQYFGMKDMSDLPKLKEFEELAENHLEQFKIHQHQQSTDGKEGQDAERTLLEGGGETDAKEESDQNIQPETEAKTQTQSSNEPSSAES